MNGIEIRRFAESDSISELTKLLNRAYAELAEMGLRYVATYQHDGITAERVSDGECFVAVKGERLVGTITLYHPAADDGCAWYARNDVAMFGQFGVDPELRGLGIGARLMDTVEARARELGVAELALDTAEPAEHLIRLYVKRGFRPVDTIQWPNANYRSVVMSKNLRAC